MTCVMHDGSCNLQWSAASGRGKPVKAHEHELARALHSGAVMWKQDELTEWDTEPTQVFERLESVHVLVAEDDDDLRAMIAARLRRDGCEVVEARSGDEALDVIASALDRRGGFGALDLVIMDVRMQGMSGLEVVEILRDASWKTPVLLVTAYPDPALRVRASELRCDVLAKPFGLSRLSKAASEALARRPS